MTKKLLLCFVLLLGFFSLNAQNKTVTGTVTSTTDAAPLPGVNVLVQGTTNGTQTDFDGNYTIEAAEGDVLLFSYLGTKSQSATVGSSDAIDIAMEEDASQLDEVVVTALGIKREEKTLTYAQQTVKSDELTKTRDPNFMNSISGKAAGVEIKKSSSGAGGSTKIVLRGSKSLTGDSSPLFVVDGIPIANNKNATGEGGSQPGFWGGMDSGDGLSQINPDDIESISILKGSNAAILYGSQGANGVVVITTKKGVAGKTTVSLNTGYTFEHYLDLPDLQFKYGAVGTAKESWDTVARDYASGYVEDFFQTGHQFINSVSISGGNERTTAYFSYANNSSTGIIPNNQYERNNFTFNQSTKLFNDKVTVASNMLLTIEKTNNRNTAGYYLNPLTGLYMFPRNRSYYSFANNYEVFNGERNVILQNWFVNDHHQSNPAWIINKQPRVDDTRRAIGNLTVGWDILDNLKLQIRGNYDYAIKESDHQFAAGSNATNVGANGRWDYNKYDDELVYTDAILTYDTNLSETFSLNAVAGASYQKTVYGKGVSVDTGSKEILFANEFNFQNMPDNVQVLSTLESRVIKQGLFANLQFGFKEMVYLDLSGRNDWASTLAGTGNDSYFYPSVGVTALLNEMFTMPEAISFAKLRASYSIVGNEVPFNRIDPNDVINDQESININREAPFKNLKPELIKSLEVGADWRFFNNRLGFDLTYYSIESQDQFIRLPAASGSGFEFFFVNAGKITNKGVELVLNGTPVQNDNLQWNTSFNFSTNKNEIVELHPDLTNPINTGNSEGYQTNLVAGGSINDIYVNKFRRDDSGRIIVTDAGAALKTTERELIGTLDPDWSLGWNNSVSFGRVSLSALISAKFGGQVFSQTESMLDGAGVSQRSADARDAGGVTVNAVTEAGTAVGTVDAETWYRSIGDRNGVGEAYVYDRTNIRLSQLSIGYDINMEKLNLPISAASISFIGNNLFFIHKEAPFDPELAFSTGRNFQSLDNFNVPSTGTYGFNLKLTF